MKRIFSAILIFTTIATQAQQIRHIKLRQQHVQYEPVHFHITSVVDDRQDIATIGVMKFGMANRKMKVTLQNGVAPSIYSFIENNVTQNANTPAVSLHVTKLKVSEKNAGFREEADVAIALTYYYGATKLIEYSGSGYQQTNLDASPYVEKLIRTTIENSMQQFDGWIADHKDILSPPSVNVAVTMGRTSDDPDILPFTTHPHLSIGEFEGPPDALSVAAAETYSGINISYNSEREGGHVTVQVVVTPYFDKSKSWCKAGYKNSKTLAHEQLHFDITAINTCLFIDAIRHNRFEPDNYMQQLKQLYKEYMKNMQAEQNEYDGETKHGTIAKKQSEWENKVKQQLAGQDCYN